MKRFLLATACTVAFSPAGYAATTNSPSFLSGNLVVDTNCASNDPAGSPFSSGPSAVDSCDVGAASANARSSHTSLGVQANGDAFAGASMYDSFVVSPDNPGFEGESGTVTLSFDFDGTMLNQSQLRFQAWSLTGDSFSDLEYHNAELSWGATVTDSGGGETFQGADSTGAFFINNSDGASQEFLGSIEIEFDIVFGETLSYRIDMDVFGYNSGSAVDFFNTAELAAIFAKNDDGAGITLGAINSFSGNDFTAFVANPEAGDPDLPVSAVPVPASLPLLAFALFGAGVAGRRRKPAVGCAFTAHHAS